MNHNKLVQPINPKTLIRILVVIIIGLIYLASYYKSQYRLETKKYLQLEDKYVRVRMMLGRDELQNLIDDSYDL